MSTPLPALPVSRVPADAPAPSAAAAVSAPPSTATPPWRRALREPLLHFVVLGGLLFAVDHALVARVDDPHVIVMDAAVDAEAVKTFEAARGHAPNAEELAALRRVWLDNEVLYREGLAMQVDRGDPAIRERVIFKALSVVDANTKLPALDEPTLRAWFEAHRARYDDPPRFDFQEAALEGHNDEATVRAFVAELNGGLPGDARAGLRVFRNRPRANLVESYGEDFAAALASAPVGPWQALKTRDGWRAVRLDAQVAAKPADFAVLQPVVRQDWTDTVLAEQRSAAVRVLAKKYEIRGPGAPK